MSRVTPPSPPKLKGGGYYAGSKEIAQETPVTLNRLEPVSIQKR
jgi:hypothetical protein